MEMVRRPYVTKDPKTHGLKIPCSHAVSPLGPPQGSYIDSMGVSIELDQVKGSLIRRESPSRIILPSSLCIGQNPVAINQKEGTDCDTEDGIES